MGAEAEAMEESCELPCYVLFTQTALVENQGSPANGGPTHNQSLIKKMHYILACLQPDNYGGLFSIEVPSFQMTLAS